MINRPDREMTSPRSLTIQVLLVSAALLSVGVIILGFLVSPFFFLLLFAGAVVAFAPRKAPSAPGTLLALILAPALLFLGLALFLGFVYHPGFFLLLLVLVIFIGLARWLIEFAE